MDERKFRTVGGGNDEEVRTRFESEGDEIEGVLVEIRDVTTKLGAGRVAVLKTEYGDTVSFFITAGMRGLEEVKLGSYVRVTYLGAKNNRNTGRTFKAFRVEVANE